MKKLKEAFSAWKIRHWDDKYKAIDGPNPWLDIDRPPLRRLWENHKAKIKTLLTWLVPLVAGAAILKALGFS